MSLTCIYYIFVHLHCWYRRCVKKELTNVRTNSSAEFGSNSILIDRIRIESAAGSNPILMFRSAQPWTTRSMLTSTLQHLQPAERVHRVATSKAAVPTYSWHAGLRIISAQLHCILCNTIARRDSDSSWRWEELMLCVMEVGSQRPSTPPFDSWGKL